MGGEVLVLGIVGMLTWLIPIFGLPIPLIGLIWGIIILRKKPARVWLVRSGVILCSLGLALSSFYTVIDALNPPINVTTGTLPEDYEFTPPVYVEPGSVGWTADGVIDEGEYFNVNIVNERFELYWNSDGEYIYIGIKAATTGWVALSIQPDPNKYDDVDIVLGYITGRDAVVYDMFGTGYLGLRAQDRVLGGSDDIIEYGVGEGISGEETEDEEAVTFTTIEFKRKYDTGDLYDHPLLAGVNLIGWAYGPDDSSDSPYTEDGYEVIELE